MSLTKEQQPPLEPRDISQTKKLLVEFRERTEEERGKLKAKAIAELKRLEIFETFVDLLRIAQPRKRKNLISYLTNKDIYFTGANYGAILVYTNWGKWNSDDRSTHEHVFGLAMRFSRGKLDQIVSNNIIYIERSSGVFHDASLAGMLDFFFKSGREPRYIDYPHRQHIVKDLLYCFDNPQPYRLANTRRREISSSTDEEREDEANLMDDSEEFNDEAHTLDHPQPGCDDNFHDVMCEDYPND